MLFDFSLTFCWTDFLKLVCQLKENENASHIPVVIYFFRGDCMGNDVIISDNSICVIFSIGERKCQSESSSHCRRTTALQ